MPKGIGRPFNRNEKKNAAAGKAINRALKDFENIENAKKVREGKLYRDVVASRFNRDNKSDLRKRYEANKTARVDDGSDKGSGRTRRNPGSSMTPITLVNRMAKGGYVNCGASVPGTQKK